MREEEEEEEVENNESQKDEDHLDLSFLLSLRLLLKCTHPVPIVPLVHPS